MPAPFTNCSIGNLTSVWACASSYTNDLLGLGVTFVLWIVITSWLWLRFRMNEIIPATSLVMFILTMLLRVMSLVNDTVPVFFAVFTVVSALVVRNG